MEKPPRGFIGKSWEDLARVFAKHKVEYLIIGKSGAILHGFPDTTQDIDLFPKKSLENGRKIVASLKELGFHPDRALEQAIVEGKDFVQLRGGPLDLDLVFAPDGLPSFEEAKERSSVVERTYPVASIEDIIKSKKAASRQKDKEVLRRLEEFSKYLRINRHKI